MYIDEHQYLQTGMSVELIIASKSADYEEIATISDAYVPSVDLWIGDYPFLNKLKFQQLCRKVFRERIPHPMKEPLTAAEILRGAFKASTSRDEDYDWNSDEVADSEGGEDLVGEEEDEEEEVIEVVLPRDGRD